jgi:hypothetical protein
VCLNVRDIETSTMRGLKPICVVPYNINFVVVINVTSFILKFGIVVAMKIRIEAFRIKTACSLADGHTHSSLHCVVT